MLLLTCEERLYVDGEYTTHNMHIVNNLNYSLLALPVFVSHSHYMCRFVCARKRQNNNNNNNKRVYEPFKNMFKTTDKTERTNERKKKK